MRKSLYILPAIFLFGVTTAGAQIGKDTESEQRNRPETQKPQDPMSSSQQSSPQQPGAQSGSKGSPQPLGSDTEKEQRNRPETSTSNQSGSSSKSGAEITTASGVAAGKDDQKVSLRGKIVSKRSGNEYMFQDSSGQVLVEIGSMALKGSNKQLVAGTEVEIQGEVGTNKGKPAKVEAKTVTLVAAGASSSSAPKKN